MLIARMRVDNLNILTRKVALVAVNFVDFFSVRCKNRFDEKVNTVACYKQLNILLIAVVDEINKSLTDTGLIQYKVRDFFSLYAWYELKQSVYACSQTRFLGENIIYNRFPLFFRYKCTHDVDDIVFLGNRAIEVTKDNNLFTHIMRFPISQVPEPAACLFVHLQQAFDHLLQHQWRPGMLVHHLRHRSDDRALRRRHLR